MGMNEQNLYQQKHVSAEVAAAVVKSGDTVFVGEFAQNVEAFDTALAARRSELQEVNLITTTRLKPLACVEADPTRESFIWNDWHFSGLGRKCAERGLASYIPFSYHQGPKAVRLYESPDVAVDVRRGSPHFGRWFGCVLDDVDHRQLYIPPGFAHGFCVLSEEADFFYKCTNFYHPASEHGIAWDDPEIGIAWPLRKEVTLSDKDRHNRPLAKQSPEDLPLYEQ